VPSSLASESASLRSERAWAISGPAHVHSLGDSRTITGFVGSLRSAGWCSTSQALASAFRRCENEHVGGKRHELLQRQPAVTAEIGLSSEVPKARRRDDGVDQRSRADGDAVGGKDHRRRPVGCVYQVARFTFPKLGRGLLSCRRSADPPMAALRRKEL